MKRKIKKLFHHLLVAAILSGGALGIAYSVKAYPDVFTVTTAIRASLFVEPKEEIAIDFSDSVLPETVERVIKVIPQTEMKFRWQNANRRLVIAPENVWEMETDYAISIVGAKSIMLREFSASLPFKTARYPQVADFYPENGAGDVVMDIEDPITIQFDDSIGDYALKFALDPFEKIVYQVEAPERKIKLLSQGGFRKGEKYAVEVFIRHKDEPEENFKRILSTVFNTKPEAPPEWDKDFALRIEQAKRFTEPLISEGKYIDVNLTSQVMSIFENGTLLDAFMVSSGKAGMETPIMTTQIYNKHPRAWSKKYQLFMPYWMAIVPSGFYGIHELPEWPGGFKEGANHLGHPVSHGCIRLGIGSAEKVFDWAEIGTAVAIHR